MDRFYELLLDLRDALALGKDVHRHFDELRADGVRFEMHEKGILFATISGGTLREEIEIYRELEAAGYDGEYEVLDGEQARGLEPALSDDIVGGLHVKTERHVRPESLTRGLVADLESRGAEVLEGHEVYGLVRAGGWRVLTSEGALAADQVLVAAGVWSKELLAGLGVNIPVEAAKGYSVTAVGRGTLPEHPLKLAEAQVVVAPYEDGVRVSGMFELSGVNPSRSRRRTEAVIRAASLYLRDWRPEGPRMEWAGLRPATPDSLPLIGSVPGFDGLYLATGHGMLGITRAPATVKVLRPLILEGVTDPGMEPFRVGRA